MCIRDRYNSDKILLLVGWMLILSAIILGWTFYVKSKKKNISFPDAFIIGLSQMVAILPGVSRSGATIATALLLGNSKKEATRFSFLMVLIPILGENILVLFKGGFSTASSIGALPLIVGFLTAFIIGLVFCKLMINIVRRGKLIYFAIYCLIVGCTVIIFSF